MNTFSTTEIAKILNVPPDWVRAQARGTLVSPTRTMRGHYRYSFRDVVLLRAARRLRRPGISARRIRRTLRTLSATLPPGRSLSSLRLVSRGGTILAGDRTQCWEPESGQGVLVFNDARTASAVRARTGPIVALRKPRRTAGEWFNLGLEFEHLRQEEKAEQAYRRVCELDRSHVNARINLGRLRHAADALAEAEYQYRAALDIDPTHPIALFNLGVVLEDRDDIDSAIESYHQAIDSDPNVAEAHYNLARLYARQYEQLQAVRHFARYRALTRSEDH